jgi:hypothetical protein
LKLNDACRYGLDNGCTTVGEAVAAVQRDACKLFDTEMEREEIIELLTEFSKYEYFFPIEDLIFDEEKEIAKVSKIYVLETDKEGLVKAYKDKDRALAELFYQYARLITEARENGEAWAMDWEDIESDLGDIINCDCVGDLLYVREVELEDE